MMGTGLLGTFFIVTAGTARWMNGAIGLSILAGGILPICISVTSLVLFHIRVFPRAQEKGIYERFVLINFFVKIVLIAIWVGIILAGTDLPQLPFAISLLLNFFSWHLFEAFRYRDRLLG